MYRMVQVKVQIWELSLLVVVVVLALAVGVVVFVMVVVLMLLYNSQVDRKVHTVANMVLDNVKLVVVEEAWVPYYLDNNLQDKKLHMS